MDMNFTVLSHLLFLAMLIFAFVYGVINSFHSRGVAYSQIVTCAVGSMLLGELFNLVMILTFGEIYGLFNIGLLGFTGCFFFTWSLAYGQIDGLGDDKSSKYTKYRIVALVQPLIFAVMLVFDILSKVETAQLVLNAVMFIPIAMTAYYNLKHLILPDVEFGIFDSMRGYNICMIFITLLNGISIVLADYNFVLAVDILRIITGIAFAIVVPIAIRGVKRWFS